MNFLLLFLLLAAPMRITKDTVLPPNGQYRQAVIIAANNVTLDCSGSTFTGDGIGVGILIQSKSNVTIRNCKVRGFDVGMYVLQGKNFVFENNDFSGNYVDDNYDIENLKPIPHGGLIVNGVQTARIAGNTSNGNIAGIQIVNSSKVRIEKNTTSKNRGWGIYFFGTTASQILNNTAEYDNRSCPQWGKDAGCGSAAIVLTQHSDRNQIGYNTLRFSGDGIYQGNTPQSASGDLEIYNNTISNSVANGIEATFSLRNYVHHNTFTDDNYGGWFGYSQQLRFENNAVRGSRVKSVQTDNAQNNRYLNNVFDGANVLLQPVSGGTCVGNVFDKNTLLNDAKIETPGCQ